MKENIKEIQRLEPCRLTREQIEIEEISLHVFMTVEEVINKVVFLNEECDSSAE